MKIERDHARITAGVMAGRTTGGPIAFVVENLDHAKWRDRDIEPMTIPRPGHADLTGAVKYGYRELRLALERASARETTMRVAVGAACRALLAQFGIVVGGICGEYRRRFGIDDGRRTADDGDNRRPSSVVRRRPGLPRPFQRSRSQRRAMLRPGRGGADARGYPADHASQRHAGRGGRVRRPARAAGTGQPRALGSPPVGSHRGGRDEHPRGERRRDRRRFRRDAGARARKPKTSSPSKTARSGN